MRVSRHAMFAAAVLLAWGLNAAFDRVFADAQQPSPTVVAVDARGPTLPHVPVGRTSAVFQLDPSVREYLTSRSWRPGCPVDLDDLRLVMVTYLEMGNRGRRRVGPLVVHRRVAAKVAAVFDRLLAADFEVARIELVDDYEANDDRSTLANNTSAFNCRRATGSTAWSQHAYGLAIDVNPLQNPYLYRDGHVLDPTAQPFLDRRDIRPGMIVAGGVVVKSFARIGWGWGGSWRATKDYQHFSTNGR
jgi:hypothetical protein